MKSDVREAVVKSARMAACSWQEAAQLQADGFLEAQTRANMKQHQEYNRRNDADGQNQQENFLFNGSQTHGNDRPTVGSRMNSGYECIVP